VVGIIVSLAIVAGGLYLVMTENNTDMGLLGAMLLVLGATFLAVNLYMHRQGFRMRRRRR
jgi:drug/metabolite transporter (DMT)-like permease